MAIALALSLPGFDGRAATGKTPLFATLSADFWKMLVDRKIDAPVLVGHSLGGTLAFLLADAERPDELHVFRVLYRGVAEAVQLVGEPADLDVDVFRVAGSDLHQTPLERLLVFGDSVPGRQSFVAVGELGVLRNPALLLGTVEDTLAGYGELSQIAVQSTI